MANFFDTVCDFFLRLTVVAFFGVGLLPIGVFVVADYLDIQHTHFETIYGIAVVCMLASVATCTLSWLVGIICGEIACGIQNRAAQRRYVERCGG